MNINRRAAIAGAAALSIAPSIVMQAVVPSKRIEPIMVVVHQWPKGALSFRRAP